VKDAHLHQLLLDAATGDPDALERLKRLVNYGECIEKAFIAVGGPFKTGCVTYENRMPVVGKPLRSRPRGLRLLKK
jgi:hypothetical protein